MDISRYWRNPQQHLGQGRTEVFHVLSSTRPPSEATMLFSLQYLATHYMCHAKSSQVTTKKNKNNMNSQQNVVPASLIRQTETKLRIKHTQSDAYWATWLRRQSHQLTNE